MIHTEITWPKGFPIPLREGYDINHVDPLMRTGMQSGRARQRRRFASVPSMVSVAWFFRTDAHAMTFESWFRDVLKDGTEWFNTPLKTPIGMQQYVCRFTEMYKGPKLIAARSWRVDAVLEVWERPLLEPGWGEMTDWVLDAGLFDFAMNHKWPKAK